MPGASGASLGRRLGDRRADARARARSRRAACRRAAAASACRGTTRWWIQRRRSPVRRRRSDRCAREIGEHMLRRGRRHMAGAVGRRRDHRLAERLQQIARDRMCPARARRSCRAPRSPARTTGQPAAFGSTSVSGPGQNAPASRSRVVASKRASRRAAATSATCAISGLKRGPALGGIEPRDRFAIGRVGAEAVDRLGRKRDEPAVARARARPPRSRRGSR